MRRLLFGAMALSLGGLACQEPPHAAPASLASWLEVTREDALSYELLPNDEVKWRLRLVIRNYSSREISAVTFRQVVHDGKNKWYGKPIRVTGFRGHSVPFNGTLLPGTTALAPVLETTHPRALWATMAGIYMEIVSAEAVERPKTDDLGNLITRMANESARTIVPLLKKNPALLRLSNPTGLTTPLAAFAKADRETVAWIVKRGLATGARTKTGWTPLHLAATNTHAQVMDLALGLSGGIEVKDQSGRTPLAMAVTADNALAATWLLKRKADPDAIDNLGRPPAFYAILFGCRNALLALVGGGANPLKLDPHGEGWMHYSHQTPRMVDNVLWYGVPVDQRGPEGRTTLMMSVRESIPGDEARWLLERGANPDLKDDAGKTTYDYAEAFSAGKNRKFVEMVQEVSKRPKLGSGLRSSEPPPLTPRP